MSSSKPKDVSPPQNDFARPIPIQDIITKLNKLFDRLSEAKSKGKKTIVPQAGEDGKNDGDKSKNDTEDESKKGGGGEMDMHNQLDKVCKELNYMISAFKKLESFEADISEPLKTLEGNVDDILTDLDQAATTESVKRLIERNLKVLRSNITKVKIQIPLQHQVSGTTPEARRYLQTTVASKEVGYLPNPYEADGIFESDFFLKEFQDRYKGLNERLKLCLLCFAIFPENAEVKKRLLRFWWVGERLPEKANFVNETVQEFVKMGFIEPVAKKSRLEATSYKMHPIIRSFIIRLAKKANFFDYDSKGNPTMEISASKKSCLIKSEGTTSWFSKNVPPAQPDDPKQKQGQKEEQQPKSMVNQKKGKKQEQKEEEQRIQLEKQKIKNLEEQQTLFNVSKQFPDLPVELFSKMRNIGVLYLGRWESTAERHMEVEDTKFLTGLNNMKKLRFFSLQGISGISKLPKSLCKLNNLRVLDLRACHNLEELPKGIGSLSMLTYLDLSECYLLDNMPKQLSQLSKLKVLKGFVIRKNGSCTLDNLTALGNLEKLSINVNNDDFSLSDAGDAFSKFSALKKLKVAWGAGGEGAPKSKNGKPEKSSDKSGDHKKQESDGAAKSGATMVLQKLKMPWEACGEGSSKSITENKVTVAAATSGEVVKTQGENRDARKEGSDATKPEDKKDEKRKKTDMKLVKLDLRCFPERNPPKWVVPKNLTQLESLYIRGGGLSNLGEGWMDCNSVKTLRLKYLTDIKTNWKELQKQFPNLDYLEKVNCPQITFCPCDASGVWMKQPPKNKG
ncbi:hypothetical protein REPUB_Repub07fG0242300 [Reevesia pubescens]